MEKFIIQGGRELKGEIEVRGSKNAAGAILAATLLTSEECIIDNLPLVSDILDILEILKEMGAKVEWLGERKIKIRAAESIDPKKMDFDKVSKSRVSVLLIGGLLPSTQEFKIARPGGDRIGLRPITTHLQVLRELGVGIEAINDFYYFKRNKLLGKEIILPEFSVTATENLLMASVLAEGQTLIKGAAGEPQVQDLVSFLKSMRAEIEQIDSHTLKIKGVKKLKGAFYTISPDPIEAGTFIVIGASNRGRIRVKNINPEHLDLFLAKIKELGVNFKKSGSLIEVSYSPNLKPTRIQALPYPGFPTDLMPVTIPLLTQAEGKSLIHDPLYENRLNFTQELRKMGADIELVDPHRAFVFGKTPLRGTRIESWDIRAGASLIIAGLFAKGQTTIENIYQIDRGYERIEERLQQLGSDIKRVKN